MHPLQHGAVAHRLRRRRRRQRCEVRRLRDGELLRIAAEVAQAGAGHADGLLAVRREVEVEREDLFLAVARLELQRDDGLIELLPARAALQHELRDLLGDRGAAFDDFAAADVMSKRTKNGDRIDAGVDVEPLVLCGDGRALDVVRDLAQPGAARAAAAEGLVEDDAVAVEDRRRCLRRDRRQRRETDVERCDGDRHDVEGGGHAAAPTAPAWPAHSTRGHFTSTTALAVLPNTSGSYISSTCAGAATKRPAVVARTRYVNSCVPSPRRVAKSETRSSWRSTWSKPPCCHHDIQSSPCASALRCGSDSSVAVVANHDSTGSVPAGIGSTTATKRRSFVLRMRSVTLMRSPALNVSCEYFRSIEKPWSSGSCISPSGM